MDRFQRRASRDGSESHGLTADESTEVAPKDGQVMESTSTEWTDEKHSLYLKSMETMFVDQLYNYMDCLGWRSENVISRPRSIQQHNPSGEFKVLRGGSWEKINFHRPGSQPSMADESHVHLKSPWIQHFRSTGNSQHVTSPTSQDVSFSLTLANTTGKRSASATHGTAASSKHSLSYSREHHPIDSDAEVSDQNFVDEDNATEKATSSCSLKRMKKTLTAEDSSNDQVVPYGKLPVTEN